MVTIILTLYDDMATIENDERYEWALARVEQLLPLVDKDMTRNSPNGIELELLSNLVADYSEKHFAINRQEIANINKKIISNV